MSLINDALRRARDAQQQAPPASAGNLPFHPVEPARQGAGRGLGLGLLVGLAIVALLVLFFAWHSAQRRNLTRPLEVKAHPAYSPHAATAPREAPAPAQATATTPVPATLPKSSEQPVPPPAPVPAAAPAIAANPTAAPTNAVPARSQANATSNAAVAVAPPRPKPAPLRLQAIVFNPKRPSAMINGKMLFLGDKLGDLRVMGIDQESATLVGGSRTNILTLSD